jgi:hypothetical protein
MALITDLAETSIGIPLNNTYARITLLRADKEGLLLQVSHYATAEARAAGAQSVLDRTVMAPTADLTPGITPLAIGYDWLKRQPDYADAQDA